MPHSRGAEVGARRSREHQSRALRRRKMYEHWQEVFSPATRARASTISGIFTSGRTANPHDVIADVYRVIKVDKCYIPEKFNEELPLYFLDIGSLTVVLFGQWLYDPHTADIPEDVFEEWDCENEFFDSFTLWRDQNGGKVLKLSVSGRTFAPSQKIKLPTHLKRMQESEVIEGNNADLIRTLECAGLM